MSIVGINISPPTSGDNKKTLDSVEKKVEELTYASTHQPTNNNNQSTKNSHIFRNVIGVLLWIYASFYIFLNFGFYGADILAELIPKLFFFITMNSSFFGITGTEIYIGLISTLIIAMIYLDMFFLFPLTYIFVVKKDPMEGVANIFRKEAIIVVLLLFPLLFTNMLFFGDTTPTQKFENAQVDTKSTWTKLMEGPLCPLVHLTEPQICLEKEEVIESTKTVRAEYDISFKRDLIFPNIDNLEKWKQKPLDLTYEIKAKGEPVYLERIVCYQNKISNSTLLSNISLENKEVLSDDKVPITGTECELSKATTNKILDRDYKIIVLLYYYIEGTYTQPIPIYNMDNYLTTKYGTESREGISIASEEAKIRESTKKDVEPKSPTDALTFTTYSKPSLPIFLGEDYNDDNQYKLIFTFKKQSSVDKLISSEILDYKLPSSFTQNCFDYDCDAIKGLLSTYEDQSQVVMDFEVNDPNNERDVYTDKISFKIRTSFYKQDTIPLIINNPDYVEPSSESKKTEAETETPVVAEEIVGQEGTETPIEESSLPEDTNNDIGLGIA